MKQKPFENLLSLINDDPIVWSLLYDIDLLPEQIKEGSVEWAKMIDCVIHIQMAREDGLLKPVKQKKSK